VSAEFKIERQEVSMRSKLLATVAAATFATVLAAGSAFAQDEQIPKRKQMQQGEAPAAQQEPANKAEMPKKKLGEQAQQPGTDQSTKQQAQQAEPQKKKPAENAETTTPAERKQVGQSNCQPGQDANCPPAKQKMGQEQPANGMKPKTNTTEETNINKRQKVGQQPEDQTQTRQKVGQQPEDQDQIKKKRLTGEGAQQPATPGGKPIQTGETQGTSRTDVDVTGSLNVSKDKAARVRDTLFRSGERTDVDINVNVDVGQALPARVRPRPLPAEIVEIAPEYRGYDYVIVHEQIVIVEPQTRKVVEVIRQGGGRQQVQQGHRTGGIRLSAEQRQQILSYAKQRKVTTVQRSFDIESGASVPSDVELVPLPDTIVSEVPDIRSYEFFVTGDQGDQIVLVDPDSHSIVDVIQ